MASPAAVPVWRHWVPASPGPGGWVESAILRTLDVLLPTIVALRLVCLFTQNFIHVAALTDELTQSNAFLLPSRNCLF